MTENRIYPLGVTTFDKAFPSIEQIELNIEEEGDGFHYLAAKKTYYKNQFGDYIPCRNKLCSNLGFSIREIVQKMVDNNESEFKDYKQCKGTENSSKSSRRDCYNYFNIEVKIKYRIPKIN